MNNRDIKVKFGGRLLSFEATSETTVGDVKAQLALDHNLRGETIRFIVSGKVLLDEDLVFSYKEVTMMGVPLEQKLEDDTPRHLRTRVIDDLTKAQKEYQEKPLTLADSHFGSITTLDALPMKDQAHNILLSLATDRGIVGIMKKYNWNVPNLAEMYPEGEVGISEVCILGLNENKGARILLRIRTDDLEGFRRYDNIKQVLIHELTHNVHGDHDSKFYTLMRQLQKEAIALDPFGGKGGIRADGSRGKLDRYRGGTSTGGGKQESKKKPHVLDESRDPNGPALYQFLPANVMAGTAAITRLTQEEQEVEDGCACGRSSSHVTSLQGQALANTAAVNVCIPCEGADTVRQGDHIAVATCGTSADDIEKVEKKERDDRRTIELNGDGVRMQVVQMFDEAIAMNQQFLGSAYTTDKLSTLSALLLGMLSSDVSASGNTMQLFESAEEALSLLVRILKGAKEGEAKRSLNKASKIVTKLSSVHGGMELLLCLGFTQAESENRLVMRLFDESFNYISTDLLERTMLCVSEAIRATG